MINRLWLTHMAVMNETLNCDGDNTYKLPHMNKDRLDRLGQLPRVLEVSESAMRHLAARAENPPPLPIPVPQPLPPLPPTHPDDEEDPVDVVNGEI